MVYMLHEFEFILKEPIKYASKGQENLGFRLTLKAPTAKHREFLIKLKQQFFKALAGLRDNKSALDDKGTGADQELDGTQVLMMLYMSGIDMVDFQNVMRAMILQGLGNLDEVPLTGYLLDQVDQNEFERLIGEYITSFLLSSWTGTLK